MSKLNIIVLKNFFVYIPLKIFSLIIRSNEAFFRLIKVSWEKLIYWKKKRPKKKKKKKIKKKKKKKILKNKNYMLINL